MQRYFAKDKIFDKIILHDSDIHHIKNVMRMNISDKIEVVYNQTTFVCIINDLDNFDVSVSYKLDENNEMDMDVTIAIGLVKEQKMDLILQKLTELGVKKIIPVKMERSIVKLDDKKIDKKIERWMSICKEASEQSHRNIIPEVTKPKTIRELLVEDYDYKFVCSTREDNNLIINCIHSDMKCGKIIFVIGPEGGISSLEEDILIDSGYKSISLGKRILRVETAAMYIGSVMDFCSLR